MIVLSQANVPSKGRAYSDTLILTSKDFEKSIKQLYRCKKHKGHKFTSVFIPEIYEPILEDSLIFQYIRGNLAVGSLIKSNIIFY